MTRKYQIANKGAKRIMRLRPPPAPESAAKTNEFAKMCVIKVQADQLRNMTPRPPGTCTARVGLSGFVSGMVCAAKGPRAP